MDHASLDGARPQPSAKLGGIGYDFDVFVFHADVHLPTLLAADVRTLSQSSSRIAFRCRRFSAMDIQCLGSIRFPINARATRELYLLRLRGS